MSPAVRKKEPVLRQVFIGRGNDVIVQDALNHKHLLAAFFGAFRRGKHANARCRFCQMRSCGFVPAPRIELISANAET